jgi:hypothetical protein
MATAKDAVIVGHVETARINLAFTAQNLERSSDWDYLHLDRTTGKPRLYPDCPQCTPGRIDRCVLYRKAGRHQCRLQGTPRQDNDAQIAFKRQQLKTMLSLLFNAADLTNDIKETISGNPLLLPKNLYDMQEKAKKTAEYIKNNLDQLERGGKLVQEMIKLKDELVAFHNELRRIRWDVEELVPEVERIEKAMVVARASIDRGIARELPLPPEQQTSFNRTPFDDILNYTKAKLDLALLAWESGLPVVTKVKEKADAVYNAIPNKTADDTAAYNAFVSSYNTFNSILTTKREDRINELTAIGNAWRQTLISLLNRYLAISLGTPVVLADGSGRNTVDPALALDDMERRAWKAEYAALLSVPTGPAIVPAKTGTGTNEWHEYTARYRTDFWSTWMPTAGPGRAPTPA